MTADHNRSVPEEGKVSPDEGHRDSGDMDSLDGAEGDVVCIGRLWVSVVVVAG